MKKALALILALVMVFALCACGGNGGGNGDGGNDVADGKTYTIKVERVNSDNYPATRGLYAMK